MQMQQLGPRSGSFESFMHSAIKNGLSNVLGLSGAVSVIINFNLDIYENDPTAFHSELYSVFKTPATETLEKSIVKELYSQMGEHFDSPSMFNLVDQITFARKLYRKRIEAL